MYTKLKLTADNMRNKVYLEKNRITYITEVKSVNSGLDEEGIVWGQTTLELSFLILCLVVQLQKRQSDKMMYS